MRHLLLLSLLLACPAILAAPQDSSDGSVPGDPSSGGDTSSGGSSSGDTSGGSSSGDTSGGSSSGGSSGGSSSGDSSGGSSSGGSSGDSSSSDTSGGSSQSSSSGSFSTSSFWSSVDSSCKTLQPDLTQCLKVNDPGRAKRLKAATNYYECVAQTMHDTFSCISPRVGITWGVMPALGYDTESGCEYADVMKATLPACSKYSDQLEKSDCCNSGGCDAYAQPFLDCMQFAYREYVHCSAWYKKDGQTAVNDCVTRNVDKLRWPADFAVSQSGDKCKSAANLMGFLVVSNILSIITAFASNYVIEKFMSRFSKSKDDLDTIKINCLALLWTFIVEFASAWIIIVVLAEQGYALSDASNTVQLFLLRPRAACLMGFLGLFKKKFRNGGVSNMLVDSAFGVVCIYYAVLSWIDKGQNNVGEAADKRYEVGLHIPNPGYGFYFFGLIIMVLASLGDFGLLFKVCILKKKLWDALKAYLKCSTLQLEWQDVKKYYVYFLINSTALYLGSWIVWGTIVGNAGQLWCPAAVGKAGAILTLYPILLNFVAAFMN